MRWDRLRCSEIAPAGSRGVTVGPRRPLKDGCLRRYREPARFLCKRWHRGLAGALRMGVDHGACCPGCCWELMATLLALGVMSLGWMALVAALIAAERLLPWKEVPSRGIAVLLAMLAVGVAFAPEDVPGLTIPGSPAAMEALERMGMEAMEVDGAGEADGRRTGAMP